MSAELIDQNTIVTIAISVSSILFAVISTLAFWLRKTLIILFNQSMDSLKKDVTHCQENLNLRIDQIDEYGQKNREISYKAKDGIAEHVKDFHTKR